MDSSMNQLTTTKPDTEADGTPRNVRLTTAQALVRYLQVQSSERDGDIRRVIPAIFGIFGHGNAVGLAQAIQEEGLDLPLYQPKNEQAMVHTAIGFAKASRGMATLACTASIGPGSTNMLTGAATATVNRLPVLLLPSDTFANRRQGPVLQQIEHPVDTDLTVNDAFRPLSTFFDRISRPEQLLTALPEAIDTLLDPARTGAVTISLHQDVQGEAFDFPAAFFRPRVWPVTRRPPAQSEIEAATALLRSASRPLVIAGGGVRYSQAEQVLRRFAEKLSLPVAETSAGKGALEDSDWLVGGLGVNGSRAANELARTADVVVCIGTRLTDFTTGSHSLFQHPSVKFVGINVNHADAHKLSATAIVADARMAIEAMQEELAPTRRKEYACEIAERRALWEADLATDIMSRDGGERMGQGQVLRVLNTHAQAGDWVVAAAGYQPGDLLKLWKAPRGSFTHIEFGFSCMGHEIPAGLGIRMHEAGRGEVFVVIGDGTYLMNPTELFTAIQEGLKLTVIVLDNGGYQSISHLALTNTGATVGNEFRSRADGERIAGGPPVSVDFVSNAMSMGCDAVLAATPEQLHEALSAARRSDRTHVIVCPTAADRSLLSSGAFWDLGVPEVTSNQETARRAADHAERSRAQRLY